MFRSSPSCGEPPRPEPAACKRCGSLIDRTGAPGTSSRPATAARPAVPLVLPVLAVLVVHVVLAGLVLAAAGIPARPSVLVLGIDTLRGDHLHCAGKQDIQTPNLDSLAADAVYFRRCQSTAPTTRPSFASIYTGLLPYHHGLVGGKYGALPPERTTLAEILTGAGYRTAAFVTIEFMARKWGLGQGFARLELFADQGHGAEAVRVTDAGRRFVAEPGSGPWFLMLHYYDVHAPYTPPPPFDRMYYRGDPRGPGEPILPWLESHANRGWQNRGWIYKWLDGITDLQYPVQQYAAGVSYADHQVGKVLQNLRERGLYDDLLIILVADHGEHLVDHDLYFCHFLPYQETIHVPLLIKFPQGQFAGRVIDAPVSTLDILPTVLDLLDLPPRAGLDGRSLLPLVRGDPDPGSSLLMAEQGSQVGLFSKTVLVWPWKLLLFKAGNNYLYQLFNLDRDPGELTDVAASRPRIVAELTKRLWAICAREQPLVAVDEEYPVSVDEATRRRLRALGY